MAAEDGGEVIPDGARDDVAVIEDERRAEFGEGPDEDDGGAGEDAGHGEGERDAQEIAEAAAAEIFRGFEHGGINVRKRRLQVEIRDGIDAEGDEDGERPEAAVAEPVDALMRARSGAGVEAAR